MSVFAPVAVLPATIAITEDLLTAVLEVVAALAVVVVDAVQVIVALLALADPAVVTKDHEPKQNLKSVLASETNVDSRRTIKDRKCLPHQEKSHVETSATGSDRKGSVAGGLSGFPA